MKHHIWNAIGAMDCNTLYRCSDCKQYKAQKASTLAKTTENCPGEPTSQDKNS